VCSFDIWVESFYAGYQSKKSNNCSFLKIALLLLTFFRPQRENWGFHAKTYGGIGFLVFDSKFKVGRKGLLVSRGHDHVGDGIHK
jgi:hypothetical protein